LHFFLSVIIITYVIKVCECRGVGRSMFKWQKDVVSETYEKFDVNKMIHTHTQDKSISHIIISFSLRQNSNWYKTIKVCVFSSWIIVKDNFSKVASRSLMFGPFNLFFQTRRTAVYISQDLRKWKEMVSSSSNIKHYFLTNNFRNFAGAFW